MANQKKTSYSRRNLLRLMPVPLAAAALGTAAPAVFGQAETSAQPTQGNGNDLGARVYNVKDYGAKGDGEALDTGAIQAAIDACTADQGGTVMVPAGKFLIGPIVLKSNVTLHIAAGATLLATLDGTLYPEAPGIPLQGDHTMGDGNVGLITGAEAENITIEGHGTIDGRGAQVRHAITQEARLRGNRRCHMLLFHRVKNLNVRDVFMYRSGYHTFRVSNSSHINVDGIRINSRVTGNNDGFHFISAEHVYISNCDVRCQDDACALFGSCKHIHVTNCSFSSRWSVFRFGGGIAENVVVSNCLFNQVFGCPIKLRCQPGSRYENMSFSNLIFKDVSGPIAVQSGPQEVNRRYTRPEPSGPVEMKLDDGSTTITTPAPDTSMLEPYNTWPGGLVRNIVFSNISGNVLTKPMRIEGMTGERHRTGIEDIGEQHAAIRLNAVDGAQLENIVLSNISLVFGGGGTAEEGAQRVLPMNAGEYYSTGPSPAYGLWARNVKGLQVNGLRVQVQTPDLRPAVVLDKVQDATIMGLAAEGNAEAESVIRMQNCSDTILVSPRVINAGSTFLLVEGEKTSAITVDGGDISKATRALAVAEGASESSVKLRV